MSPRDPGRVRTDFIATARQLQFDFCFHNSETRPFLDNYFFLADRAANRNANLPDILLKIFRQIHRHFGLGISG